MASKCRPLRICATSQQQQISNHLFNPNAPISSFSFSRNLFFYPETDRPSPLRTLHLTASLISAVKKLKHLSTVANDVVHRCAKKLDTSVDALEDDFKLVWNLEIEDYSRKFVEYCSTMALKETCPSLGESVTDVSFSRFTFDMMVAWQMPSSADEQSHSESSGKGREDRKLLVKGAQENEDVSIFYSDIMPLLVDHEPGVQEDTFVWFASLLPLCGDVVNGRFTFETLTAVTNYRLHFPAYDKFLKEVNRHLQRQDTPTGVEFADDEFILHVEGTMNSQRVVRHIGGSSWPGLFSLSNETNKEAFGTVSYEDALEINLSENTEQTVKSGATGPWGAPLFDKAIVYECSEMSEVVLEFPELTSSTRRDHWLALIKEIMLLHQFISKYKLEASVEGREMQARTMLAIIRLHAAREMLRMAPPVPKGFLIFTLLDELPKGDFILEELAEYLKQLMSEQPCSACSILRSLRVSRSENASNKELKKEDGLDRDLKGKNVFYSDLEGEDILNKELKRDDSMSKLAEIQTSSHSLDDAIVEATEQEEEIEIAKATTESVKEEGVTDSILVLLELLKPLKSCLTWAQEVLQWQRPNITVLALAVILFVTYREWVGVALASCLLWVTFEMIHARKTQIKDKYDKIVVCTASDKSSMESVVSARHGLRNAHDLLKATNISILKIQSILLSRTEKHANIVMVAMIGVAVVQAFVPFKYMIMIAILSVFTSTSKINQKKQKTDSANSSRRPKEWWNSIPIVPVELVVDPAEAST